MSHFIAFYNCILCEQTICGLLSNTLRIVETIPEEEIEIINPQQIKLEGELKLYCQNCHHGEPLGGVIDLKCSFCHKPFKLFFYPSQIGIVFEGKKFIVETKSLFMEYDPCMLCSLNCFKEENKKLGREKEPIFLDFK